MTASLTLVSCGMGPGDLTARHRAAVAAASVLAGGPRLLGWFPEFKGDRIPLDTHVAATVDQLVTRSRTEAVTVLASGDALFFGIGRLFASRVPAEGLTILPNVTAAQAAFARLGLAWEQARFFTVHGRTEPVPWRTILQAPVAVIYADPARRPAVVAEELIRQWPGAARCHADVLADLGAETERHIAGTLADIATTPTSGLAMLIVRRTDDVLPPPLPLGLDDDTYRHEAGLITHPEVRAVILSKLRLGPGTMWDIGSGSGSVGVEAAGLCEGLAVHAVEKNASRCATIAQNAAAAGCARVQVVKGAAPAALEGLPAPRAVFVGGGGADVRTLVELAFERLVPGGVLVASAVMLETRARLLDCLPERRTELVELDVRRARALGPGHGMEPTHPIALFIYRKELT